MQVPESQETPETETPEPTDAEQEADFAAAFEDEPTATPATPEPAAEPAQPEVPAQPEPEYVQLTKAQYEELKNGSAEMRAALKTLEDRSNGSIGNIKQTLAQIQAATPAGQSVQFSDKDFEELQRDFPEMTASMVAALNRGMARLKGTGQPAISDDVINAKVQERLAPELDRARKDSALEVMDVIEPDWRKTVTSPEWGDWLSKQSPDYQQKVNNSWKLPEVREAITKFKADSKPAPKPAAKPNRFAAAVAPKSAGGYSPTMTEQQEFEAAFNSK